MQALVVSEEPFQGLGILGVDQPFECPGQALALNRQCPAHQVLEERVSGRHDPFPAQQINQLAQDVQPAGWRRARPAGRQGEKQVPITLGEARKAPQQLVLLPRENLQAMALWEAIAVRIIKRKLRHACAG